MSTASTASYHPSLPISNSSPLPLPTKSIPPVSTGLYVRESGDVLPRFIPWPSFASLLLLKKKKIEWRTGPTWKC